MEGGSGFGEFIGQIQGLLLMTVGAGVIWLFLTYVILQRAAERRRRKKEGLAPLPSFFTQAYHYARKSFNQEISAAPVPPSPVQRPAENISLPDLDALTADLPAPNLDLLTEPTPLPEFEGELVAEEVLPPVRSVEAAIEDDVVLPVSEPVVSDSLSYVPGSNELPGDAVEMMRVWRDVSDGRLIIGMKDQLFISLNEIQDPTLRNRFKKLVQDLNQIASSQPVLRPAPQPAKQPEQSIGIADQIESYLQSKLVRAPALAGRSIHVHSGMGGGVSIEVDGQYYEAVGDIADLEVRQFLQETIQEWEARH